VRRTIGGSVIVGAGPSCGGSVSIGGWAAGVASAAGVAGTGSGVGAGAGVGALVQAATSATPQSAMPQSAARMDVSMRRISALLPSPEDRFVPAVRW
jgi:hypothetical protein